MEKEIDNVENYYLNDFKGNVPEDYFTSIMKDFLGDAMEQCDNIEKKWETIEEKITELGKFYGEDPKKYKFEEFIQNINKFIIDWKEAVSEYERKKEVERKRLEKEIKEKEKKEQQELKNKLKREKEKPKEEIKPKEVLKEEDAKVEEVVEDTKTKLNMDVSNSSEGVLDDLTQNMLDGSAFKKKKKKKKEIDADAEELLKQMSSSSNLTETETETKTKKEKERESC